MDKNLVIGIAAVIAILIVVVVWRLVRNGGKANRALRERWSLAENDPREAARLAADYETGSGAVEPDLEKRNEALRLAVRQGHGSSILKLAECLLRGDGIERNAEEAEQLLWQAEKMTPRPDTQKLWQLFFEQNDDPAKKVQLAQCRMENGQEDEAMSLFAQAAQAGNEDAVIALADICCEQVKHRQEKPEVLCGLLMRQLQVPSLMAKAGPDKLTSQLYTCLCAPGCTRAMAKDLITCLSNLDCDDARRLEISCIGHGIAGMRYDWKRIIALYGRIQGELTADEQQELALCQRYGSLVEAKTGDAEYALATMIRKGELPEKIDSDWLGHLVAAGKMSHGDAIAELVQYYQAQGLAGTEEACRWEVKASLTGQDSDRSWTEAAMQYLKDRTKSDDAAAMLRAATFAMQNAKSEADREQAQEFLKQAAVLGDERAQAVVRQMEAG